MRDHEDESLSFSKKLRKIRKAAHNQLITIPIKYYTKEVKLVGEEDQLVFKNFVKGAEMMTPREDMAAVENLFEWAPDAITVGQTYTLFYDGKSTGLQLQLYRKPTLEEVLSDNLDEDQEYDDDEYNGEPLKIVYVFTKVDPV